LKCEKHRDKEAVGFCAECGSGVCKECVVKSSDEIYCKDCFGNISNEDKPSENDMSSYIVCEKCGGLYELKKGESLENFDSCECGGKLKVFEESNKESDQPIIKQNYEDKLLDVLVDLKENINLKAIFIGTTVGLLLAVIFSLLILNNPFALIYSQLILNNYIPFTFVSALITGYIVGKNPKYGILNGVISGLIATTISLIIIIFTINYTIVVSFPNYTPLDFSIFSSVFTDFTILIIILVGVLAAFLGVYFKLRDPNKTEVEIKWKPIIISLVILIILGLIPQMAMIYTLVLLISTIYIGFTVNKSYTNGIIHGIILVVIATLIIDILSLVISIALTGTSYGLGKSAIFILHSADSIIFTGVIGSIGGVIGCAIKKRYKHVPSELLNTK